MIEPSNEELNLDPHTRRVLVVLEALFAGAFDAVGHGATSTQEAMAFVTLLAQVVTAVSQTLGAGLTKDVIVPHMTDASDPKTLEALIGLMALARKRARNETLS